MEHHPLSTVLVTLPEGMYTHAAIFIENRIGSKFTQTFSGPIQGNDGVEQPAGQTETMQKYLTKPLQMDQATIQNFQRLVARLRMPIRGPIIHTKVYGTSK